jgi:molybdopterin molybdotransferase
VCHYGRVVISLEEARAHVLGLCPAGPRVLTDIADALGCVLSDDVTALDPVPPFDNSAVDGFAVRAADTETIGAALRVIGTLAAGAAATTPVQAGEAMRIMTGAPMPAGADAIVMVEDSVVSSDGATVTFTKSVRASDALRRAGSDVEAGEKVFEAGTVLHPAHIGMLASLGRLRVAVHRRPRVALFSTGDELVDDDRPLAAGQIRESNRRMLRGLVSQAGCTPIDLGTVRDDEAALEAVLLDAAQHYDAIITTGGVSMGDFDIVKAVLSRRAEMRWMQIAIKPAKPFAFGLLDGVPLFGLPGNPVSSLISFEMLARPALRQMMGHTGERERPRVLAVADEPLARHPDGKLHITRVRGAFGQDGRWHIRPGGAQGSHQLAATAHANSLALIADGPGVEAGGIVETILLGT